MQPQRRADALDESHFVAVGRFIEVNDLRPLSPLFIANLSKLSQEPCFPYASAIVDIQNPGITP